MVVGGGRWNVMSTKEMFKIGYFKIVIEISDDVQNHWGYYFFPEAAPLLLYYAIKDSNYS